MTILFSEYSIFSQKFIEVWDEYIALESEIQECKNEAWNIPDDLIAQKNVYHGIVTNMITEGWNRWQKTGVEMRKDGWNYWMAEDKILRQERYGK